MDFKSVMLVIIAVLMGAGFTLVDSAIGKVAAGIEKAAGDMKPEPEVRILYCYEQGEGFPDVCESTTEETP